eukprot:m.77780 g.77780  ORF g.77780 m.77780 type:complete len:518 (-) comp14081_c0_seq1:189-1742(-)
MVSSIPSGLLTHSRILHVRLHQLCRARPSNMVVTRHGTDTKEERQVPSSGQQRGGRKKTQKKRHDEEQEEVEATRTQSGQAEQKQTSSSHGPTDERGQKEQQGEETTTTSSSSQQQKRAKTAEHAPKKEEHAPMKEEQQGQKTTEGEEEHPAKKGRGHGQAKQQQGEGKDVMFGIRFTHPDKELFPGQHLTKADLAQYYLDIEEHIMPHIHDRPMTFVRGIKGIEDERVFVQRHPPSGIHSSVKHGSITQKDKQVREYMYIQEALGLVAGVQMDTLEYHVWVSRFKHPDHPDQLVFDLDPGEGVSFDKLVEIAQLVHKLLDNKFHLRSFVMVTGSKGIHIKVPLNPPESSFDVTHEFAKGVAYFLELSRPDMITAKPGPAARTGKVFVDYVRNSYAQTSIVPYSTRARPGAPVATPVSWDELPKLKSPEAFNVESVRKRVRAADFNDPWKDYYTLRQQIPDDWRSAFTSELPSLQGVKAEQSGEDIKPKMMSSQKQPPSAVVLKPGDISQKKEFLES